MGETMKLSEAIRLGSTLKPQHYSGKAFFITIRNGFMYLRKTQCSCVLGAAIDAAGLRGNAIKKDKGWPREWGMTKPQDCPACEKRDTLGIVIIHLNDNHRWTRECIADWIESSIEATTQQSIITHLEAGSRPVERIELK